jgi:hypothetical protein
MEKPSKSRKKNLNNRIDHVEEKLLELKNRTFEIKHLDSKK